MEQALGDPGRPLSWPSLSLPRDPEGNRCFPAPWVWDLMTMHRGALNPGLCPPCLSAQFPPCRINAHRPRAPVWRSGAWGLGWTAGPAPPRSALGSEPPQPWFLLSKMGERRLG